MAVVKNVEAEADGECININLDGVLFNLSLCCNDGYVHWCFNNRCEPVDPPWRCEDWPWGPVTNPCAPGS